MIDFIPVPKGVFADDVVDPEKLAEEFRRLHRVASRPSQHQWTDGAFTAENFLKEGHPCRLLVQKREAHLYQETYDGATGAVNGDDPILNGDVAPPGVPDRRLFQVPYNRGLVPVQNEHATSRVPMRHRYRM